MKKLCLFILFILLLSPVLAQPVGAEAYRLHVDDRLQISVWGHEDLSRVTVVGPDGKISLPILGEVQAEGLTLQELQELVSSSLKNYLKDPVVDISLQSYQKMRVMVLGQVMQPGTYELAGEERILDLISRAGGPTELSDLSQLRLTRGDETLLLNLQAVLEGVDSQDNLSLQDGDVLYLPERVIEVTIMGEVKNPGRYQLEKGLDLTHLLARAGGIGELAAPKARLTRGEEIKEIDLQALLAGEISPPLLEERDVFFVPRSSYQVTILGEVARPGSYPWQEGLTLAELLAVAGNATARGDLQQVKLFSSTGEGQIYNLEDYLQLGKDEANPALAAGDLVLVEEIDESSEVTILGEVNRPGAYQWHENLRLADLLAKAGNATERGNLQEISILRATGSVETVNLEDYFQGKGENPLLQPGDVVKLNEVEGPDWNKIFNYIAGFNLIKEFLEIDW